VSDREGSSGSTHRLSSDLILAVALSVILVISLAAEHLLRGTANLLETACAIGAFLCLVPRRADPQLSAIAAAIVFALSAALGSLATIPGELDDLIAVPVVLLAYSLGIEADQRRSIVALVLLGLGLQIANGVTTFNLLFFLATVLPWVVGRAVRSGRFRP
jgi:hypothetical protein